MSELQQAQEIKKQKLLALLTIATDQVHALENMLRHIEGEAKEQSMGDGRQLVIGVNYSEYIKDRLHSFRHSLPVLIDEDSINAEF